MLRSALQHPEERWLADQRLHNHSEMAIGQQHVFGSSGTRCGEEHRCDGAGGLREFRLDIYRSGRAG